MRTIIDQPRWVIDGNYRRLYLEERVSRADLVVFLDLPRRVCMVRIIARRIRYARQQRPDMTEGCPEQIDREFWLWAWRWPRHSRPSKVLLMQGKETAAVAWLRSRKDVERFIRALPHPRRAPGVVAP
jgi:adenylate kinase family enzyme